MNNHPDLFSYVPPVIYGDRDGETFDRARDGIRLNGQMARVYDAMRDGHWRSLSEIARLAECPEASASARFRDLKKPKFGGFTMEHRNIGGGVWQYRMAL